MSKAVHTRISFAVVGRLNPEKYSEEENAIFHGGIASHIGIRRSANSRDTTPNAKPKNRVSGEELDPSKLQESSIVQEGVPCLSHTKVGCVTGEVRHDATPGPPGSWSIAVIEGHHLIIMSDRTRLIIIVSVLRTQRFSTRHESPFRAAQRASITRHVSGTLHEM